MFRKPIHLPLCLALVQTGALPAQDKDLEEARGYKAMDACNEAVAAARRSLAREASAEAHWIVGSCFLEYGRTDSAIHHFTRCLALDSTHADALIGRGRAQLEAGDAGACIADARAWSALRPGRWRGRLLEGQVHLFLRDSLDAAERIFQACLAEEPSNEVAQYYMAITAYNKGDTAAAFAWLDRAERDHPDDPDFPALRGRWLGAEERWTEAAAAYGRAHGLSRSHPHAQNASFCLLLANTDPAAYTRTSTGRLRFTAIGAEHMAAMDAQLRDPGSPYHYAGLVDRFRNEPERLSLDALFMAYYGQHTLPGYSPYADDIGTELRALLNENKFGQASQAAAKHLRDHPVCLDALHALALAARHVDEPAVARRHMLRYNGLLQAILASGSGDGPEDPLIVASVRDEYIILGYLGLERSRQSLLRHGPYILDRMDCADGDGAERSVYFEISRPFASLGALFSGCEGGKKGGRKGR